MLPKVSSRQLSNGPLNVSSKEVSDRGESPVAVRLLEGWVPACGYLPTHLWVPVLKRPRLRWVPACGYRIHLPWWPQAVVYRGRTSREGSTP